MIKIKLGDGKMKELKVSNEVVKIGEIEVKVIEGGFGENNRIVTELQISIIHAMPIKEVRKSIKRLVDNGRLHESTDYIDVKSQVNTLPMDIESTFGVKSEYLSRTENIYILSERGYVKLVKSMDDNKSWDIMDEFVDKYFSMRKQLKEQDERADLLLDIYKGGIGAVTSAKKLTELEIAEAIKPLNQVIEVQKPKADYFDALVDTNLLTNFRDTAKELKVKEGKFIEFLLEKGYVYRDKRGKLKPVAQYVDVLFELKEFTTGKFSDTQTRVTPRGRETFRLLIDKFLK